MTGRDDGKDAVPGGDLLTSFELLTRAKGGDREAVEWIYARYLPRLRRWCAGRLPPHARTLLDTDDVVQETMQRAVDKLPAFELRGDGAFLAYLRQAAMNRIRDEVRRAGRQPAAETLDDNVDDAFDLTRAPLERSMGSGVVASYEKALSQLRPEEASAVVARIEFGLSYEEIARELSRPSADAARMAVSRALVRLAELMDA